MQALCFPKGYNGNLRSSVSSRHSHKFKMVSELKRIWGLSDSSLFRKESYSTATVQSTISTKKWLFVVHYSCFRDYQGIHTHVLLVMNCKFDFCLVAIAPASPVLLLDAYSAFLFSMAAPWTVKYQHVSIVFVSMWAVITLKQPNGAVNPSAESYQSKQTWCENALGLDSLNTILAPWQSEKSFFFFFYRGDDKATKIPRIPHFSNTKIPNNAALQIQIISFAVQLAERHVYSV